MIASELDTQETKAQHEALFATLRAIEVILPYAASCQRGPRPLTAARSLLERLAGQLRTHFAAEECDAYFGRIAADDPRLARRIGQLVRDHSELRALVDALVDGARRSDDEWTWRLTSRAFWRLRERLAWHEREENELVFQLHQVDLGQSAGG